MGALDAGMAAAAQAVVNALVSNSITVNRWSATVYDYKHGEETPAAPTSWTMKATPATAYKTSEIDGTSVLLGDRQIIVPRLNLPTAMGSFDAKTDRIVFPGSLTEWKVVTITELRSGDEVAAFVLQLRQ